MECSDLTFAKPRNGSFEYWHHTGAFIWMPKGMNRLVANYGNTRLDNNEIIDHTHILQGRVQLVF